MKDLVSGGICIARDLLRHGGAIVAGRLADSDAPLRRVA
jgi:hypothetical protein